MASVSFESLSKQYGRASESKELSDDMAARIDDLAISTKDFCLGFAEIRAYLSTSGASDMGEAEMAESQRLAEAMMEGLEILEALNQADPEVKETFENFEQNFAHAGTEEAKAEQSWALLSSLRNVVAALVGKVWQGGKKALRPLLGEIKALLGEAYNEGGIRASIVKALANVGKLGAKAVIYGSVLALLYVVDASITGGLMSLTPWLSDLMPFLKGLGDLVKLIK